MKTELKNKLWFACLYECPSYPKLLRLKPRVHLKPRVYLKPRIGGRAAEITKLELNAAGLRCADLNERRLLLQQVDAIARNSCHSGETRHQCCAQSHLYKIYVDENKKTQGQ